jgi:hypothetical protein
MLPLEAGAPPPQSFDACKCKCVDFWQINTDLKRITEETWADFWTNWKLGTTILEKIFVDFSKNTPKFENIWWKCEHFSI